MCMCGNSTGSMPNGLPFSTAIQFGHCLFRDSIHVQASSTQDVGIATKAIYTLFLISLHTSTVHCIALLKRVRMRFAFARAQFTCSVQHNAIVTHIGR